MIFPQAHLSIAVILACTHAMAQPGLQPTQDRIESNYGIIEYKIDTPGSVVFITKRENLFGTAYTMLKTICYSGDLTTLFLGRGETAGQAISNATVKGNGGLLIGGTGDEAPRIACALAGLSPGANRVVTPVDQATPR